MESDSVSNLSGGDVTENCSENSTICVTNSLFLDELAAALNLYYTPFLIIFGCFGNLVSIFVFYVSKLRLQSTSVYLSTLAFFDTIFLLQLIPPWLHSIQFSSIFHRPVFCQFIVYVSYVSCFGSTWTIVAFTVERFVAVLYPLKRNSVCTVRRAKYVVIIVILVALVINVPVLKFTSASINECNVDSKYLDAAARFNLVDTVIAFTFPLTAIVVLNTRIMIAVCSLKRARQMLLKAEKESSCTQSTSSTAVRSQTRITRMLLLVSSVFVLLNLPGYTMRILAYAYDMDREKLGERWPAFQQIALAFFYTTYGINFMLYCLSGQNFRQALCHSVPWLRRRAIRRAANARRIARNHGRTSSISMSYASAATDGANTVSSALMNSDGVPTQRFNRCESVIKRWTFDNSRQRKQNNLIELETYNAGEGTSATQHAI